MTKPTIGIALFVGWLFIVLSGFYVVQKPFTLPVVMALSQTFGDIIVALWIASMGTALGHRLLYWLKLTFHSIGELVVISFGLGLGILGLATFGLGLAGFLYRWLFWGITILLTLFLWQDFKTLFQRLYQAKFPYPSRVVAMYLLLLTSLTLLIAVLPPTDWDGLLYHLTAPKIFIEHHQIIPGIDAHPFYYYYLSQVQFIYAMLLWGDITAKLLHPIYGLFLVGLVYLTSHRHLHPKTGWLAVLVCISMPMITVLAGFAYNDLILAFYQLIAVYAFVNSQTEGDLNQSRLWLFLCGIFAGLAMGLKYTSFITSLTIGLILVWQLLNVVLKRSTKISQRIFVNILIFSVTTIIIASPLYIKNYFFTGNPVYPFVFGGLFWDEFRATWYQQAGTGIGWSMSMILTLPIWITLGIRDVNYFDGRLGPLFLVFFPLILLYAFGYRRNNRPLAFNLLLIFALAQYFFWMLGVVGSKSLWQSRLLLTGLVIVSPIIGWIWFDLKHLDKPAFSLHRFISLLVGVVLIFNLIEVGLRVIEHHPMAYLTGQESRENYLKRRLGGHYIAMQRMNETLTDDAVVLFLWEPRTYLCKMECRPDVFLDKMAHTEYLYHQADTIAGVWHNEGITHILLFNQGLRFIQDNGTEVLSEPAVEVLSELQQDYLTELFDDSGYKLYQLELD